MTDNNSNREKDLNRELRDHLELDAEARQDRGVSADESRFAAQRDFGNVTRVKEVTREMWGWASLERFWQDVRYSLRLIRRNPGFTAVAVLTLALGIGANTAIFSIVNATFLRPLPFPGANRIFVVRRANNQIGGPSLSMPLYLAWKQTPAPFDAFGLLLYSGDVTFSGVSEPERLHAWGLTPEVFQVLGVYPALGRPFQKEDSVVGAPRVVILSDSFWREKFSADPGIVGRAITINGISRNVVGVMPRGFQLPLMGASAAQIWLSPQLPVSSQNPSYGGMLGLGRLRPDATAAQADAALTPPLQALHSQFPKMVGEQETAHLQPVREYLTRAAGTMPLLLLGAVGLVLLIACANVANLLLARSTVRKREIAVRTAIGASRGRLIRQLLTESLLLGLSGGLLGLLVCYSSFRFIQSLVPADLVHVGEIRMDAPVLGFTITLSLLTGLIFGLIPAFQLSKVDLHVTLKEGSAGAGASRGRGRLRSALVVCEVGLSLVLVAGAALLCQSFVSLMHVQPGFNSQNVLTFGISLPRATFDTNAKCLAFFDSNAEKLASLAGVEQVAYAQISPLDSSGAPDALFTIEGDPSKENESHDAEFRFVSPNYFRVLGVQLVRGRGISAADTAGSEPVVFINQAMALKFWPGQDALGQRIWFGKGMGAGAEPAPRTVAGIVGDVRDMSLAEPPAETMYIPFAQGHGGLSDATFIIHSAQDPRTLVPAIRSIVHESGPNLPLSSLQTMDDAISTSLTSQRFATTLLVIFGSMALLIATVGVYGVVSYSVAQRTHEIGIRVALGASRGSVLGMILGQGLRLAFVGIAAGLVASFWVTRLLRDLLYGIKPTDPVTFVGVALALIAVALAACWIPARRATRVDPIIALRYE
jgi:putative ABC transport system permease protein